MKIQGLDYKSSYIITKLNIDYTITNYNKISLGKMNIYYDDYLEVTKYDSKDRSLILLGYCYDIRNGLKNENDILEELIETDHLHEELDYISGRYILILSTVDNQYIYSDALQVKPLVYHTESNSLASHDTLLKHILIKHKYKITRPSPHKNNSLDYTQYNEIKKYNPSLYTDFDKFEFVRFYPRTSIKKRDIDEIFDEMKLYLDQSKLYLENVDKEIFVTVTGGIDSRVSTSLTRDFSNKIEYLTYTKKPENLDTNLKKLVYKNDTAITSAMKKYLGWNHTIIDLDDYTPTKKETDIYLRKFNSRHAYSLINYYRDYKKYKNALHVKSTAFGMGKADFSSDLDDFQDTYEFYEKCIYGLPANFKNQPGYQEKIMNFFERNLMFEGYPMGRHFYDMFYLESRMGNWHSSLTLETDPETDEFILINTRKYIDLIMEPKIEDRRQHKLYKKIVDYYWPVLLKFGINKRLKPDIEKMYEEDTFELDGIKIIGLNKVMIETDNNIAFVKPDSPTIKNFELYSFALQNDLNEPKKIRLKGYYKNEKAKNKINVIIKTGMSVETYDILELANGINIDINKDAVTVSIFYNYSYDRLSWISAGRLSVELL